jgi:hypothetical protein
MTRLIRKVEEEKEVTIVINHPDDIWRLNRLAKRMSLPRELVVSRLLRKEGVIESIKGEIRNMEWRIDESLIEHRETIIDLIKSLVEKDREK